MRYVCVFICFLLWLIFTLLLSSTVIGLVISVSDEWQEMGDKIIDTLTEEDFRVTMERDVELSEVARAVKNQHHKKKI